MNHRRPALLVQVASPSSFRLIALGLATALALAACGRDGLFEEELDAADATSADTDADTSADAAGPGTTDASPGDIVDQEVLEPTDSGQPDGITADTAADAGPDVGPIEPDTTTDQDTVQPPDTFTVSGVFFAEDRQFGRNGFTGSRVPTSIPGVLVRLAQGGDIVCETFADETGLWTCELNSELFGVTVDAQVRSQYQLEHGGELKTTTVLPQRGDGQYEWSSPIELGPDAVYELQIPGDSPANAAAHILTVLHTGFVWMADRDVAFGNRLTIRWTAGRAFDCGSCYSNGTISLGGGLADTDEYDDHIILHELAHHLVATGSQDSSPGGPHRDRLVEPDLAWSEGHAYAWAALVADTRFLVDTFADSTRVTDLEQVTVNGVGVPFPASGVHAMTADVREEWIAALIYDVFDAADSAEPNDLLALDQALAGVALYELALGWNDGNDLVPRGFDLADWLQLMSCNLRDETRGLSELARANRFDWPGPQDCSR